MRKLKIMFHLNSLEQGGAERVVSTLANHFIANHDVIIATMWVAENEYEIDKKIRRIHVGLSEQQEKQGRLAKMYARNHNLRNLIKKEKPDIVISFTKKANYRALIAAMGTGTPVITSVRTNPYDYYTSFADKLLIPLLYPRAAGNVFQTVGARDFFAPDIRKKSRVILNPLNPKYIGVEKSAKRKKEVVQSGRIVSVKNQQMLIEAFILVHENHPDYVLKIYGTDSKDGTWEKLEKCIEQNHAESYVFLMGGSSQLEKDIVDAAAFAFSSDWEGLPNSLMEAMAMGLPVVATDCPCGGPATLIQNEENGLLVPVKDKEAMTAGINRLIEDKELAENLAKNAQEITQIADVDKICNAWEEYIFSLV